MSLSRFEKLVGCFVVALAVVGALCSYAQSMTDNHVSKISYGKHDGFERVIVDLNSEPTYNVTSTEEPESLIINIDHCVLPQGHQGKWIGGRLISQIGVSQYDDQTVRIVLELKEGELQRSFSLPPNGSPYHRLVIDVRRSLKAIPPASFRKPPKQETPSASKLPLRDIEEVQSEKEPVKAVSPSPQLTKMPGKEIIFFGNVDLDEDLSGVSSMEKMPAAEKDFAIAGFILVKSVQQTEDDGENEQSQALRNRMRLEGKWDFDKGAESVEGSAEGKGHILASVESDCLWFGPDNSLDECKLDLFEGYLYWAYGPAELTLGRQIVRWGKTDQISPVDNLNPEDLRQFVCPVYEDRRIPNWMARVRRHSDFVTLEGVWIFFFEPSDITYFGTNWAVFRHLKEDIEDSMLPPPFKDYVDGISVHKDKPGKTLENGQWGGRISSTVADWDLGFSYLYAWENLPYYESFPVKGLTVEETSSFDGLFDVLAGATLAEEDIMVTYKRSHIFGFEFETVLKDFGLRGEAAYFDERSFLTRSLTSVRKPVLHYVVGLDRSGDSHWYANVQFAHLLIPDYDDDILYFKRDNTSLNGQLSVEFWQGNFEAAVRYDYWLSDGGYYLYPRLICKYVPSLDITLGLNVFGGESDTFYGAYDDNDQVFLSLKYFF